MQSIDEFIEGILNEKGITDLEPDIKAGLIEEMKTVLNDQINRAAVEALSEEKAAELDKLIDSPDFSQEKFQEFMMNSGVNLVQVAADTMLKFRGFYLGSEA